MGFDVIFTWPKKIYVTIKGKRLIPITINIFHVLETDAQLGTYPFLANFWMAEVADFLSVCVLDLEFWRQSLLF